jgi:hypothetical protein
MTYLESENKIKNLLDKGFLNRLLEIGKLYGWRGDYEEIWKFIEELHKLYGIEKVDANPYELTPENEPE